MFKKVVISLAAFFFGLAILLISVFKSAAVRFEFSGASRNDNPVQVGEDYINIDYELAYPGNVLPGSALWNVKALRDKLWLFVTTSKVRKSELMLLFADKRVGAAKVLFENNNPDDGFTALTKAEKYLDAALIQEEQNRTRGVDTTEFLNRLSLASLKHYQIIEEILSIAPDDAKPLIIGVKFYPKKVYETSRNALLENGLKPPENPFNWD